MITSPSSEKVEIIAEILDKRVLPEIALPLGRAALCCQLLKTATGVACLAILAYRMKPVNGKETNVIQSSCNVHCFTYHTHVL